jgi:hypothetical protein
MSENIYVYAGQIYRGNAQNMTTTKEISQGIFQDYKITLGKYILNPYRLFEATKECSLHHVASIREQVPSSYKHIHRVWEEVYDLILLFKQQPV